MRTRHITICLVQWSPLCSGRETEFFIYLQVWLTPCLPKLDSVLLPWTRVTGFQRIQSNCQHKCGFGCLEVAKYTWCALKCFLKEQHGWEAVKSIQLLHRLFVLFFCHTDVIKTFTVPTGWIWLTVMICVLSKILNDVFLKCQSVVNGWSRKSAQRRFNIWWIEKWLIRCNMIYFMVPVRIFVLDK